MIDASPTPQAIATENAPQAWTQSLQRVRWLAVPVTVFLGTRLLLLLVAYLGEVIFPGQTGAQNWHSFPGNLWLDIWVRFDGGWYSGIATGYNEAGQPAFFPLYPLLMRLATPLFGDNQIAGMAVSNLALLALCCYLYLLAWRENGEAESGTRAVLYLTLFPAAYFLSAVYTESLFLLCTVAAYYHARRREWGIAACFGLFATATRLVGILIYGVILYEWMTAHGWTLRGLFTRESWSALWRGVRTDWFSLLVIQLIPLGLVSYMLFLNHHFDDPLLFFNIQRSWDRELNTNPVTILIKSWQAMLLETPMRGEVYWTRWIDLGAVALILATFVPVWRKYGAHLGLYMIVSLIIPLSTETMSLSRYMMAVFPLYLILAEWGRRRAVDQTILAVFASLMGLLTAATVNWFFVA